MALWRITLYEFRAPCQNSEKTNDTIPWKRPDRGTEKKTDERKDGHTLFCGTLPGTAGVQKEFMRS